MVKCADCGLEYGTFPDMILPDDVWARIAPREGKYGILCPTCIARRLDKIDLWYQDGYYTHKGWSAFNPLAEQVDALRSKNVQLRAELANAKWTDKMACRLVDELESTKAQLAAYQSIGLTPKQVMELQKNYNTLLDLKEEIYERTAKANRIMDLEIENYNLKKELNAWQCRSEESDREEYISKALYDNLRRCFDTLVQAVLGEDYYNTGMDIRRCDQLTCRDIARAVSQRALNKFHRLFEP